VPEIPPVPLELRRAPDGMVVGRDGDDLAALYASLGRPASADAARRRPWAVLDDPHRRDPDRRYTDRRYTDAEVASWPRLVPATEVEQATAEVERLRDQIRRVQDDCTAARTALAPLSQTAETATQRAEQAERERDTLRHALAGVLTLCRVWAGHPCQTEPDADCVHCAAAELLEVLAAALGIQTTPAEEAEQPVAEPDEHQVHEHQDDEPSPPAAAPHRPLPARLPRLRLDDRSTRWVRHAACHGHDPELWFPLDERPAGPCREQITRARSICQGCVVRAECLEWAVQTGQAAGIWGGTTTAERRELRRQQITEEARALAAEREAER